MTFEIGTSFDLLTSRTKRKKSRKSSVVGENGLQITERLSTKYTKQTKPNKYHPPIKVKDNNVEPTLSWRSNVEINVKIH